VGKKPKMKSVTFRMSFYLAMLIAVLVAAICVGNLYNTKVTLEKETLEKGWILVKSGEAVTAEYLISGTPDLLRTHLYKMESIKDVNYVSIINKAGKIVAHTDQSQIGKNISFKGGIPNKNSVKQYPDKNGRVAGYDFISPIITTMESDPIGYFRLGLDTSGYNQLLEDLIINMLMFFVVAVIAGIMLAKVMANRILRQPIQDLKEATELGILATAFNSMTGHLANLFMSVRTSATELTKSSQSILNKSQELGLAAEGTGQNEPEASNYSYKRQLEALHEITISAKKLHRLVDRLNTLSMQFKI